MKISIGNYGNVDYQIHQKGESKVLYTQQNSQNPYIMLDDLLGIIDQEFPGVPKSNIVIISQGICYKEGDGGSHHFEIRKRC